MSRSRTTTSDSSATTGSATTSTLTRTTRSRAQATTVPATTRPTVANATGSTSAKVVMPAPPPTRTRKRVEAPIDESPTKASSTAPTATRMTSLKERAAVPVRRAASNTTAETARRLATTTPARTARTASRTVSATKQANEVDELADALQDNLKVESATKLATRTASTARGTVPLQKPPAQRTRVASGSTIASSASNARARTRTADSGDQSTSTVPVNLPRRTSKLGQASPSKPAADIGRHARTTTTSTSAGDSARISIIPASTSLCIPARALTPSETQEVKMTINKCIASFKSAQAEGYRYEPSSAGKRPISTQSRQDSETGVEKQWTDSKIKAVVDDCSAALRSLTGDLLARKGESMEWDGEAIAAIQLRMQLAKACSDFGLVSSSGQ